MRHILYSCNPYLKWYIANTYFNARHYVWCSEHFDAGKLGVYSAPAHLPASSTPGAIYRELSRDVGSRDKHSYRINAQKATLSKLAVDFETKQIITSTQKDEIIFMLQDADFYLWRPLLYVIPSGALGARIETVAMPSRAGYEPEYIIKDLSPDEFDIVEI